MPMLQEVTSQLIKFLSTVATIETYDYTNPMISNGDSPANFDFLYVVKGKIEFHLSE